MNYWSATDDFLRENGGSPPICPSCHQPMFAADDHGRFACFCGGSIRTMDAVAGVMLPDPKPIPQMDTTGMTDAEKAKIPAANRLHQPSTAAEARFLALAARRPLTQDEDDPEYVQWLKDYAAARKAVDEERIQAQQTSE